MKRRVKEKILLIIVIVLFAVGSYFAKISFESLSANTFLSSRYGELLYFLITALAVFIAPISTLPLLPFAVSLWGPIEASVLTIIAWTSGSVLVFCLSRKYGRKLVARLADLERIESWSELVPEKNIFWIIVFMRFLLPVDVLSYALGLFSKIELKKYLLATILGLTPFAFFFAYFSKIPILIQIISMFAVFVLFAGFYKKIYLKLFKK